VGEGDFLSLLKNTGYTLSPAAAAPGAVLPEGVVTSATTIFAFKYGAGVLIAGDRRATAGMNVMYDRADKVIDIDRHAVMAIAGVPATGFEIARVLEHTFKYYRRSQLQELSLEGKVRAISRLLKENISMAVQGIGAVAPIFAAYDLAGAAGKIYFYDILGAQFEGVEFATSGSGSSAIQGVLHFVNRWSGHPLSSFTEEDAIVLALRLLETAAEFDAATGGVKQSARVFPILKTVTPEGISTIAPERMNVLYQARIESAHV